MWPPRTIIVPVVLSPGSDRLVTIAAGLAAATSAELILAGLAPIAMPTAVQAGELTPLPSDDNQRLIDLLVRERLEELASRLPVDVEARTVLRWGPVATALVAAAREEQADLIVVSLRRSGAIGHALHDHADRYVLHHSDVPVLVIPMTAARPHGS